MSDHQDTQREIENILKNAFNPCFLEVIDDSSAHRKHAESKLRPAAGHFKVIMQSSHFDGETLINRHRLVYQKLNSLMDTKIHALSLSLYASNETI